GRLGVGKLFRFYVSSELLSAAGKIIGQFGIIPNFAQAGKTGFHGVTEKGVNFLPGHIPHLVDKAGMGGNPVTNLFTLQGGSMQANLQSAMRVIGGNIQPSVTSLASS